MCSLNFSSAAVGSANADCLCHLIRMARVQDGTHRENLRCSRQEGQELDLVLYHYANCHNNVLQITLTHLL